MKNLETCFNKLSLSDAGRASIKKLITSSGDIEEIAPEAMALLYSTSSLKISEALRIQLLENHFKKIQKVSGSSIHDPLLSSYDKKDNILTVYLPKNLESFADNTFFNELFRVAVQLGKKIKLESSTQELKLDNDDLVWSYAANWLQELTLNDKIVLPRFIKGNYASIGRNCARFELVNCLLPVDKFPLKYRRSPGPEFFRYHLQRKETPLRKAVFHLLKTEEKISDNLSSLLLDVLNCYVHNMKDRLLTRLDYAAIMLPGQDFFNLFRKTREKDVEDKRTRRLEKIVEYVDATKPSELPSAFEWERPMLHEVYEKPWVAQNSFIQAYTKEIKSDKAYAMNFPEWASDAKKLIDAQWHNKNIILKATNNRFELLPQSDQLKNQSTRLSALRIALSEYASLADAKVLGPAYYDIFSVINTNEAIFLTNTVKESINTIVHKENYQDTFPRLFQLWNDLDAAKEVVMAITLPVKTSKSIEELTQRPQKRNASQSTKRTKKAK